MTVAQLIVALLRMPQDAQVNTDDGEFWPVLRVRESSPAGIVILETDTRDELGVLG